MAASTRCHIAQQLGIPTQYVTILQVAAIAAADVNTDAHMIDAKSSDAADPAPVARMKKKPIQRPHTDTPISRQHFQALKAMFTKLDRDHDGRLDARDFVDAMRREEDIAAFLHLPAREREGPTKERLIRRFYQVDRDHSHEVTFEEFVTFCAMSNVEWRSFHAQLKMPGNLQFLHPTQVNMAIKCFINFDLEDSGFIDKKDFAEHFTGAPKLQALVSASSGDILSASQFLSCCDQMAVGGMSDVDFAGSLQLS